MAHISHKLRNPLEGALAGGGDPATSPLYVFGPFLKLVLAAGLAQVTFGGAIWLAVLTIVIVSAMYRLVMQWITDGSGGSGLCEEEFGSGAAKINAAITFIEYTLTFLVSMSAMVTFVADRFPALNERVLGLEYRALLAVALSLLTGWLVNRGPQVAARAFGPATAAVLVLLWLMVFATLWRTGLHLPVLSLQAFVPPHLPVTIGGYVRILAVMTGIEVFANLVAAYSGTPAQQSRKAFISLVIIMGTTAATMLIVGPAIFTLSDPANTHVSVFTQTMDQLLPAPLPYLGTLIGIVVLMSAAAASAQGLQNLALGLRERHYIPPAFGARNKHEVADKPVWLEVGLASVCFLLIGTHEELYLALYAAGVFVLLSLTGWAVTQRLLRAARRQFTAGGAALIAGTILASVLTSAATLIIFAERFREGAWAYLVLVPLLFGVFTYFRRRMGAPSPEMDYLGRIDANLLAGFGFHQAAPHDEAEDDGDTAPSEVAWRPEAIVSTAQREQTARLRRVLTLLDGSENAARALPIAQYVCATLGAHLTLLSARRDMAHKPKVRAALEAHLVEAAQRAHAAGVQVDSVIRVEPPAEAARALVAERDIDLVIVTAVGGSGDRNWLEGGLSSKLVDVLDVPVLLVQVFESGPQEAPHFGRVLVALDGSAFSEQALPYARAFAAGFGAELMLLSVPAVPESGQYRAPASVMSSIRRKAVGSMRAFVESVAEVLRAGGLTVRTIVTGSYPAHTIVDVGKREAVDLIMISSQGRGGLDLLFMGSVAQQVVQLSDSPILIVPIHAPVEAAAALDAPPVAAGPEAA